MAVKTAAALKAQMQSTDPQDQNIDIVDSALAAASASAKGQVELSTNAEALTGTDAERAVTPAALRAVVNKLMLVSFTGSNLAGACTATGLAVGDKVIGVAGITDMGIATAKFQATITVVNQIQQTAAENLSAKNFVALVLRPS